MSSPHTADTPASRHQVGRCHTACRASRPSSTSRTTSEYIRVSVAYRTRNGELASSRTATQPVAASRSRRAATQATGRAASANSVDSARTAVAPVPNSEIHPCSSR
jgi:hypothetical protein